MDITELNTIRSVLAENIASGNGNAEIKINNDTYTINQWSNYLEEAIAYYRNEADAPSGTAAKEKAAAVAAANAATVQTIASSSEAPWTVSRMETEAAARYKEMALKYQNANKANVSENTIQEKRITPDPSSTEEHPIVDVTVINKDGSYYQTVVDVLEYRKNMVTKATAAQIEAWTRKYGNV